MKGQSDDDVEDTYSYRVAILSYTQHTRVAGVGWPASPGQCLPHRQLHRWQASTLLSSSGKMREAPPRGDVSRDHVVLKVGGLPEEEHQTKPLTRAVRGRRLVKQTRLPTEQWCHLAVWIPSREGTAQESAREDAGDVEARLPSSAAPW